MTWQPISRGKVDVHGIHPEHPGLLQVSIELSDSPPAEWRAAFIAGDGVASRGDMHKPDLTASTVWLQPPDSELEEHVRDVDARIAAANKIYKRDVLPAKTQRQSAVEALAEQNERRIDDARRRAEDL